MLHLWKLVLLFVVLTPGIVLTLPPVGKKIFGTGKSNFTAACVHAVIFVLLLNCFNIYEGFQLVIVKPVQPLPNASVETMNLFTQLGGAYNGITSLNNTITGQNETIQAIKGDINSMNSKLEGINAELVENTNALSKLELSYKDLDIAYKESVKKDQEVSRAANVPAATSFGPSFKSNDRIACALGRTGYVTSTNPKVTVISSSMNGKGTRTTVATPSCKLMQPRPIVSMPVAKVSMPPPKPPAPPPKASIGYGASVAIADEVDVGKSAGVMSNSNSGSTLVKSVLSAVGLAPTPRPGPRLIGPAPQPIFGIESCPPGENVYYDGQTSMCA